MIVQDGNATSPGRNKHPGTPESVWDVRRVAVVVFGPTEALAQMHPVRSLAIDSAITYSMTDEDAGYSQFFRDQYPRVVRTIHLIVHDQARAEDIAQDAFLGLLKD